jgi:hypothetical protein
MRRLAWATYLWPGLPQLWCCGLLSGLVLAMGFAVVLNLLLLASLVWVELLTPFHLRLGWTALGCLWLGSAGFSAWMGPRGVAPPRAISAEGLFREALSEYLQGNWFEAERALASLMRLSPRDVEGRLLLATLLRRTLRLPEASEQLARLELLRDAHIWSLEIGSEKRLLARARTTSPPTGNRAAEDSPPQASSQSDNMAA